MSSPSCPDEYPSPVVSEGDDVYVVSKIVRHEEVLGKVYFKVLWEGYPEDQATWEGIENLHNCDELLKEYVRSIRGRARARLLALTGLKIDVDELRKSASKSIEEECLLYDCIAGELGRKPAGNCSTVYKVNYDSTKRHQGPSSLHQWLLAKDGEIYFCNFLYHFNLREEPLTMMSDEENAEFASQLSKETVEFVYLTVEFADDPASWIVFKAREKTSLGWIRADVANLLLEDMLLEYHAMVKVLSRWAADLQHEIREDKPMMDAMFNVSSHNLNSKQLEVKKRNMQNVVRQVMFTCLITSEFGVKDLRQKMNEVYRRDCRWCTFVTMDDFRDWCKSAYLELKDIALKTIKKFKEDRT